MLKTLFSRLKSEFQLKGNVKVLNPFTQLDFKAKRKGEKRRRAFVPERD
jgi:hypothetical protein